MIGWIFGQCVTKNKNLRKLVLTENQIPHVEEHSFRDLKLEVLDLSFNSLTRLDFHPGLVENLRLVNNQIRFITSDFFRGRPEFTNNLKNSTSEVTE